VGIAIFYGTCKMLGVAELDLAFGAVTRPLMRRLKRD
jgi:hypothetical protein